MEGDIVKPTEANSQDVFTTETAGLADALGPSVIRLQDGDGLSGESNCFLGSLGSSRRHTRADMQYLHPCVR